MHPIGETLKKNAEAQKIIRKDYRDKVNRLNQELQKAVKPYDDFEDALKKQFADKAHELAIQADASPYETWGGRMRPTSVELDEEGIRCFWDINGDYAPEEFLCTWEELTKEENNAGN